MEAAETNAHVLVGILELMMAESTVDRETFVAWREARVQTEEIAQAVSEHLCNQDSVGALKPLEEMTGCKSTHGVDVRQDGDAWIVRMSMKLDGPLIEAAKLLRDAGR